MNTNERIRRFVDGELDASEVALLLAEAARDEALSARIEDAKVVSAALEELRDVTRAIAPSDDLVERSSRRAIAAREAYARRSSRWIDWLWEPRTVRVRLVSLLATGCAAAAAVALVVRVSPGSAPMTGAVEHVPSAEDAARRVVPSTEPTTATHVPVRFVLPAAGARSVAVAGEFNQWSTDSLVLTDGDGDGVFSGSLRLPAGTYAYMFVVDGARWVTDPFADTFRDDGFGNRNAVLRID